MLSAYSLYACPAEGCPRVARTARTCRDHGRRFVRVRVRVVLRELEPGEEGPATRAARHLDEALAGARRD